MEDEPFKPIRNNNSKKLSKKAYVALGVLTVVFVLSIFFGIEYYTPMPSNDDIGGKVMSIKKAEKQFISDTKSLLQKYGITDGKIESIPDGTMAGFTLFKVTVSSPSFDYLSEDEKADFLKSWSAVDYSESKVAVSRTVESHGNIYEYSSGMTLVNGAAFNREIIVDDSIEEFYTEPLPLGPEYPKMSYGDDKNFAFEAAKATVLKVLFSPSTAIFPYKIEDGDVWEMSPGIFSIKSYGDSQNKFGAMLRFQYIVEVERLDWNSYKVLDVQID